MPFMGRDQRGFNLRQPAHSGDAQLVVGLFLLLFVVGGGLIWLFYGVGPALVGVLCMGIGLLFFLFLYGLVWLLGHLAGE